MPGTFSGPGNRDIDLMGKAIVVRSQNDDPGECIIDCGGTPANPHRGFIVANLETTATVLRGLTIMNGYAEFGGGIYLGDPADKDAMVTPTIENCRFQNNRALSGGGAMYIFQGSSPQVSDCLFQGNFAHDGGGMYLYWYSSARFTSCVFDSNTAVVNGGGVNAMWEQFNSYIDSLLS